MAFSLPGISDEASTTVSPSSMCTKLWLRWAIRDSAESGSPCDPVEISTTFSGGRSARSLASSSVSGGTCR
jgi:hypothetical protein